ncbi:class I glutamine amidotransferase-like protein [Calycina marina]|uniref:Class I glutamine amidotransferase-like protein n=1 Tax=Calycina marina TaxID=1763456 RepID=A0A9P7Z7I4_9HELO|nr:class I glutamine amidotransferase-like protein [Calycina marina]
MATQDIPVIRVLMALHPGMDTLDFTGPLEILSQARHNINDASTKAFDITFVAQQEHTVTGQGASVRATVEYKEAYATLKDYDILIIPGGGTEAILKNKTEPLGIIKAYSDVQKKYPEKERTLFSVCSGSLLLAQQGVLSGLSATTHPDYFTKLEKLNSEVSQRDLAERCDVIEERYVVNNLRYDLGENPDENPHIRRKSDAKRPPNGRKGSMSWKESNTRRESNARRAALRLGGLRVITSGGVTCGLDASLYLVSIMVSEESASEIERIIQYKWNKGIVVDGIDI